VTRARCLGHAANGVAEYVDHPDNGRPLAFSELDLLMAVAYTLVLSGWKAAGPVPVPAGGDVHLVKTIKEAHELLSMLIEAPLTSDDAGGGSRQGTLKPKRKAAGRFNG
jgi:hypothetical protein